jgi:hypothetical protein
MYYGPRTVTNGLVFCVDAADRNSYPGSGTTWTDLSGNSNNGTLTNGPTFSNSNGGCIVFDGIDDYVSISNNTLINPNNDSFSIVAWVNSDPSNGGDGWDLWVAKRSTGTNGYYIGALAGSGMRFVIGNNVDSRTDTAFIGFVSNTWTMVTAILDRTTNTQTIIRNNFDESASTTPSGGTYSNTANLNIGADFNGGNFQVNGRIASVRLYNRAITSLEVLQNYNATKTRFGL